MTTAMMPSSLLNSKNCRRKFLKCKICSRQCFFHFYGVIACEGCKQFFRRVVIKRQNFTCEKTQTCNIVDGDRCRGCRLTRCLFMGMDPKMVQLKEKDMDVADIDAIKRFIDELESRKQELWRQYYGHNADHRPQSGPSRNERLTPSSALALSSPDPLSDVNRLINSLVPLEYSYRRMWESTQTLPSSYMDRHESIEDLLNDDGVSLLNRFDEFFTDKDHCWDKHMFIEEQEREGMFSSEYMKLIAKDWFLCVETAKTMAFFKKLELADKIALLKTLLSPVNVLCSAYYSSRKNAKTITRGNGMTSISLIHSKQFRADPILQSIYERVNTEMVERMAQANIAHDEFLLLFASIFTNWVAAKLSAQGHDLVYAESIKYSKALHKLLQSKYGIYGGAQKFATAMNLLEASNRMTFAYQAFVMRMEIFHERKDAVAVFPKAIIFYPEHNLH